MFQSTYIRWTEPLKDERVFNLFTQGNIWELMGVKPELEEGLNRPPTLDNIWKLTDGIEPWIGRADPSQWPTPYTHMRTHTHRHLHTPTHTHSPTHPSIPNLNDSNIVFQWDAEYHGLHFVPVCYHPGAHGNRFPLSHLVLHQCHHDDNRSSIGRYICLAGQSRC